MWTRLFAVVAIYALVLCSHSTHTAPVHTNAKAKAKAKTKTTAHFVLTEPTTTEHELLLQQLEVWGIQPFQTTNKENPWSLLPAHHKEIDLLWTLKATPPISQLLFPKTFSSKLNYIPGSERFTSNDLLYTHLRHQQQTLEKYNFNYIPQYYQFPRDQSQLPEIYANVLKKVEYEMKRERDWHIYQRFLIRTTPTSGNDDAITSNTAVVLTQSELETTLQSTRFLHQTVDVMQYIEPYLMDGHKFTTGFYVIITSLDPLRIYLYPHPLIKIATVPYPTHLEAELDPTIYNTHQEYISPWDFPVLQSYYYEFPSSKRTGTNSWSIVKRYLMEQGVDTIQIQEQIQDAIIKTITTSRGYFQQQIGKLQRASATIEEEKEEPTDLDLRFFQLFRFEFELDDNAKPWLTQIHSNPSLIPHTSVFGTDEAMKKNMIKDVFNLIGIHPQASPSFESYYKAVGGSFCTLHCQDRSLVYNTACWACPGWFAPYVATRLFDGVQEYTRRGSFSLLYPSVDKEYAKFMDTPLSEHDYAFDRYVKSLSASYSETPMLPVFDPTVVCVYRKHCSDHGDCINGKCFCDEEYEGSTCYVPKDTTEEAIAPSTRDSWSDRVQQLWSRASPATIATGGGARAADGQERMIKNQQEVVNESTFGSMMFGLGFIMLFLIITYRLYVTDGHGDTHKVN